MEDSSIDEKVKAVESNDDGHSNKTNDANAVTVVKSEGKDTKMAVKKNDAKDDSDDDDKPLATKLKPSSTPKAKDDSDSDDDVPLAKKVVTKKKRVISSDNEEESTMNKKPSVKQTPSVPKKETPKAPPTAIKKESPASTTKEAVKKTATTPAKATPAKAAPVKATKPESPIVKQEADSDASAKRKREEETKNSAKKAKVTKTPVKKVKKEESSSDSSSSSDSESSSSSDSESSSSSSSSSSSESDSDDDVPLSKRTPKKAATPKKATPKKTPKKEKEEKKSTKKTPKKEPKKEKEEGSTPTKKKKKEDEEPEYKWWLEKPLPEGKKWRTLEHNGVVFPDPYKPHGVKMLYDGKPVDLTSSQEELATYYAQYLETDHVRKPQFNKNFFKEWQTVLSPKGKPHVIQKFEKCDFTPIHKYVMEQREVRKNRSKEEKDKEKEEKAQVTEKYGWAMVDGHKQKVANYRVEPPGLFLGRGDHPKAGMVKKRIVPADVTINIGKKAKVPECPIEGQTWGKIIHNDEVAWLAFWKDPITDGFKYVWLAASSRIKGEADMKKFETARKLKDKIDKIREKYMKELTNKDTKTRQRATALYVIDHLALRVGNEKDEDEADTVGCCSLRVEHIKLKDPSTVEFDFLGKDSMRYQNSVEVDKQVYANFKLFVKDKAEKKEIFDQLTTTALNSHLKQQMEGLTAKVFRTYNASITLERELAKMPEEADGWTVDEKMLFYNRANREVAILCNHQRTVSKNFGTQMDKIEEKIKELEDQKDELKDHMKALKTGTVSKKRKKPDSEGEDGEGEKKKRALPDDVEKCKKHIQKIDERIAKWETKKTEKDELKTVSLTTSKINYIDPRISVAWAKKCGVPIEKIFSKTLRQKFPWAMDVEEEFEF